MAIRIPAVRVEAELDPKSAEGFARARNLTVTVSEPPEVGGSGAGFTSLELFLMGLASCEASMFRMIASRLRVVFRSVRVSVQGEFEMGYGLKRLHIVYNVSGASGDVDKVVELVRSSCPVYNTLKRAGVEVTEEVLLG